MTTRLPPLPPHPLPPSRASLPVTDLTLRDFFAAQAVGHVYSGFDSDAIEEIGGDDSCGALSNQAAFVAYLIADAMLLERERRK